ncbi:MAG: septum formation protein Maf [Candidatus Omnitrophica bacterium]|nr:septum formation protein Maf [Candidatus Omnitrophota bacterium]
MKKIILASASPQRKNLMNLMGIPYTIKPSQSDELTKITTTCSQFVKDNALLKARAVADKEKDAIVIGADTIVYVGGKRIIGKPKDMAEAKSNLKLLMSHPHWVYTGVALVDTKNRKEIADYEKTKIFMTKLTDAAIDEYYTHMSPLDKAGGFDIEGKGSMFIRRIEGCYFNVVGLPLAKLRVMLKKMGVHVLSLILVVGLAGLTGCTTEYNLATHQEESLLYGTEREKSIGAAAAQSLEKQLELSGEVDANERVEKILKRIVAVCDRQELVYTIKIIDEDTVNAISLPGGYIYVYKGLIDKVKTDDELASVIAHEVGHITARHAIKRQQKDYGDLLLQVAALQAGDGQFAAGVNFALTSLFFAHAQEDEFEADSLSIKYLKKAGFNPQGSVDMLKILKKEQDKGPTRPYSYWRTHPYLTQRIAAAGQVTNQRLEFRQYLNLTGERENF